ncbi:MAG TPA: hypothetical protein VLG49_01955 [Rhabdochlamydiaceae bacterium]|nr:hypothetical protein [Rhabdochlamydiaceae bacterium]
MSFKVNMSEGCGICLKPGANVEWHGTMSKYAHDTCYNAILPIENRIHSFIETSGLNPTKKILAHVAAVHAVEKACRESIMAFLQRYGEGPLARLFDTVGIDAAKRTLFLPDSKI